MKFKKIFFLLAIGAISLQSCDNDNDDIPNSKVPAEVRNTFTGSYPDTRNLKWETEYVAQQQFYKAEFNNSKNNSYNTSAWYATDGTWYMTETEMPYSAIPAAIRTAFESSEYATWKRDREVDRIERVNVEPVYIIDVESAADEDVDLFYSESGILIKAIGETNNGNNSLLPNAPSGASAAAIAVVKERYPNAVIMEVDIERGRIEIDIIDDNKKKEVLLDSSNAWLSTSWDVAIMQLPEVISNAVKASQYASYRIDDAEYFEAPAGDYYLLELESGKVEVYLKVDVNGQIIK